MKSTWVPNEPQHSFPLRIPVHWVILIFHWSNIFLSIWGKYIPPQKKKKKKAWLNSEQFSSADVSPHSHASHAGVGLVDLRVAGGRGGIQILFISLYHYLFCAFLAHNELLKATLHLTITVTKQSNKQSFQQQLPKRPDFYPLKPHDHLLHKPPTKTRQFC